jgi:sortase A
MGGWFGSGRGVRFWSVGAVVLLLAVMGVSVLAATGLLFGAGASEDAVERAAPVSARETPLKGSIDRSVATESAAREEGSSGRKGTEKRPAEKKPDEAAEAKKEEQQAAAELAAAQSASASASPSASASAPAPAEAWVAPADTTMYLSVPKMGISDVPVVEGTTEASLSAGAGHYTGSGYPWIPGSNTYIAGHRIGYPGTPSDRVFYNLPNLVMGDEVIITDSNGHTYTYAVSEILEVPITEVSVTAPVGRDVVSLQTCIEDFGDYWSEGPNWNVRYVVRAERVA